MSVEQTVMGEIIDFTKHREHFNHHMVGDWKKQNPCCYYHNYGNDVPDAECSCEVYLCETCDILCYSENLVFEYCICNLVQWKSDYKGKQCNIHYPVVPEVPVVPVVLEVPVVPEIPVVPVLPEIPVEKKYVFNINFFDFYNREIDQDEENYFNNYRRPNCLWCDDDVQDADCTCDN